MYHSDAAHANATLEQKLRHLYTLRGGVTIDLSIRPAYYELLRRLGDPHRHLPPVIHVAGTNGKGSTIAFLRAMLEAGGYRVHAYTSPHLCRFNERIVLAGQEIDDDQLEALLDEITAATGDLPLTFFEITTALAFTAFARAPADIVLLETGLGGRLDSTNVIDRPRATVITPLGLDHQEYLGETLPQIAAEKAGILKPGVPCITAPQDEEAEIVIVRRAAALPCPLYQAMPDTTSPLLGLIGAHQIVNAAVAREVLRIIAADFPVSESDQAAGLRAARWPGRLQRLPDPAPGWEFWLDGAHNEHSARALAAQCAHWQTADKKNLHLIVGMLRKRDPHIILTPLRSYAASLTVVPIPDEPQAYDEAGWRQVLSPDEAWSFTPSWQDAVQRAVGADDTGRILITGSLYLIGNAIKSA